MALPGVSVEWRLAKAPHVLSGNPSADLVGSHRERLRLLAQTFNGRMHMHMATNSETIITLGFEGGSVDLRRKPSTDGTWEYAVSRNESAMADLLSEEDEDLIPMLVSEPKHWVPSFDEGMRLLEPYHWQRCTPYQIHPEYRNHVWDHVVADRHSFRSMDRWARACGVSYRPDLVTLADWILASRSTVVLTGAGISVASGLPDFRSPGGWWRNIDPTTVATVVALHQDYDTFHAFYSHRIRALEGLIPNPSHEILAKWEGQGLISAIATQNVDGFHQMAGATTVYELHGSIKSVRCSSCNQPATVEAFLSKTPCAHCAGDLRPNVTLFDESLPQDAWENAMKAISVSELVLVIGSSLNVYPANRLPRMTNGLSAAINLEETAMDSGFNLVIHGKAEDVLPEIDQWVQSSR